MEDWEKRQRKLHEILAMPEYELRQQIRIFGDSIYIFRANADELEKLLLAIEQSPQPVGVYVWPDGSPIAEPHSEINRLLHNYATAAKTLVEHSRLFYDEIYKDAGVFPEYPIRVKADFADDPLSCFVQKLRNYYVHYKLPRIYIYYPLIVAEGIQPKNTTVIPAETIAHFDWGAGAKAFIDVHERELVPIDLLWVSTHYRNKVTEFYEWFQQRQNEIHAEELARLEQAENELKLLL